MPTIWVSWFDLCCDCCDLDLKLMKISKVYLIPRGTISPIMRQTSPVCKFYLCYDLDFDLKVTKRSQVLADAKRHQYFKYEPNRHSHCWVSQFDICCDLDFDLNATNILADPKGHKYPPNMSQISLAIAELASLTFTGTLTSRSPKYTRC